jgi:hypothetical protein
MEWVFVKQPFVPGFVRDYLAGQAAANADLAVSVSRGGYIISPYISPENPVR